MMCMGGLGKHESPTEGECRHDEAGQKRHDDLQDAGRERSAKTLYILRMEAVVIVLTTLPDAESAKTLADSILRARLAACVTRLPGAQSRYWWQDRIEEAQEELLLIKTTDDRTKALQAHIRAHHPYETPECLCLGVASGLPEYLQWVRQETTPHPTASSTDQSSSS